MTDYRTAGSLGERIQAARKARGMSARQLAEAIDGSPSQATIENIELGRKAAVDIVQLLNIAMAVKVPLSYLLAPMGTPDAPLDLLGLSKEFGSMTVAEFDAWLASVPEGARVAGSLEERNATAELQALRQWRSTASELSRLQTMLELERSSGSGGGSPRSTEDRVAEAMRELDQLAAFLRSAGWPLN